MSQLKSQPILWCLFRVSDNKIIEGLHFDEARAIILSVGENSRSDWLAWREDWADWKTVDKVDGLLESFHRSLSNRPPEVRQDGISIVEAVSELTSDDVKAPVEEASFAGAKLDDSLVKIEQSRGTSAEDFIVRTNQRFQKRYKITISVDGKLFETFSVDISVGGVLLEDPLPGWIEGQFKIRIRKPNLKQEIELSAHLIDGQIPGKANRIGILPLQSVKDAKNLEIWLAA